jgi:Fic family protein
LALAGELERLLGRVEAWGGPTPEPRLRKQSRVRTVRGSVGIEGNDLTEEQVTAVLEGKRVAGSPRAIREVTNANAAYERAPGWRSTRERDFLAAHRVLMSELTDPVGGYRRTNVGVLDGTRVAHIAPPTARVPTLMKALFSWLRTTSTSPLVRACVAHYEILFIHPFTDGNGRMARLWQHVVMLEASPLFRIVAVESVIRERQRAYYDALGRCDRRGDSAELIELLLEAQRDALATVVADLAPRRPTPASRLAAAQNHFGRRRFSRADYRRLHPGVSTATASRDLRAGLDDGALESRGEWRLTEYRFRRGSGRRTRP